MHLDPTGGQARSLLAQPGLAEARALAALAAQQLALSAGLLGKVMQTAAEGAAHGRQLTEAVGRLAAPQLPPPPAPLAMRKLTAAQRIALAANALSAARAAAAVALAIQSVLGDTPGWPARCYGLAADSQPTMRAAQARLAELQQQLAQVMAAGRCRDGEVAAIQARIAAMLTVAQDNYVMALRAERAMENLLAQAMALLRALNGLGGTDQ